MQRGSGNLVSDSRESGNCERAVFRGNAWYTWKSPEKGFEKTIWLTKLVVWRGKFVLWTPLLFDD